MKTITLHIPIHIQQLYNIIQHKLNPLFHERRQSDLDFIVGGQGDTVEISQPELYDGVLFSLTLHGAELQITRSEHYVDDVNSLTVESILNDLFKDLAGDHGTDLVQEG